MIIKSIELENIRSYKTEKIDFIDGINFLSGDIGCGKSSILLAIEFALLGFKRGDLEGYHLLRKGERKGSVKLIISNSDNSEIEIFRNIKKGKTNDNISQENGYIKVDNNLLELSPQELNAKIFEIFNFPIDFLTKDKNLIYRFTIYTPQEHLKEILFSENEKRLEVIRKLFNIDKYKQLSNAISIYLTDLKTKKKILSSKVEDSQKLNNEIKEIQKEIESNNKKLEVEITNHKPIIEKINKYKDALNKREDYLENSNNRILLLEKNLSIISEIQKRIQDLNNEVKIKKEKLEKNKKENFEKLLEKNKKEIEKIEREIKELNKEKSNFNEKEKKLESLEKDSYEIKEKINDISQKKAVLKSRQEGFDYMLTKCRLKDSQVLENKLKTEVKKLVKIKDKFNDLSETTIKLNSEIENMKISLINKKEHLDKISSLENCPICEQEVNSNHKKHINKKNQDEIREVENKIKILEKELNNKVDEKKEISDKLKEFEEKEKKLFEISQKVNSLKEREEIEKVQFDKLKKIKKEITDLEKNEYDKKIKEIELESSKIKNELKNLEKINSEISKKTEEKNKFMIESLNIENISKEKKDIISSVEEYQNRIKEYEVKISKKKEFEEKLKDFKEKKEKYSSEKNKLKESLEKLYEKDKEISSNISRINSENKLKSEYLKEKEKIKSEIESINKELEKIIYREGLLSEKVIKISSLIEKTIFTKYYVEFNEEFEKLFKELIEDNDIEVRLDDEFSIIVEQNGFDIDIKNLSGGEKSSLAIAYRLALKKIIENNLGNKAKLSLLILDEPTDGFSNEQVDRLGNILKVSNLKQIILVSHDEKIESIADTVLKVEKINHVSSVN